MLKLVQFAERQYDDVVGGVSPALSVTLSDQTTMQVECSLFCGAAEVNEHGILYILRGGYDLVRTSAPFPFTLPRMSLVVRVWCEPSEFDREHVMHARMVDARGQELPSEMKVKFTPRAYPRHPERRNRMTLVLDYLGITFPEPGDYGFRFVVDGGQVGEASLEVVKIAETE